MYNSYQYPYQQNMGNMQDRPRPPRPNNNSNNNDDRFLGGGFLGPFLLGGVTGGLVAPLFYGGYNNRPYYNNYYYGPYPYYPAPYYRTY